MRRLVMAAGGGGEARGEWTAGRDGGREWGSVLSVLEACARMGGRVEADTFEAVCLLVHNQDLKVSGREWAGTRSHAT